MSITHENTDIIMERCKGSVELSNSRAGRVNKTEDSHSMTAILISTKPYPKDCLSGSWSHWSHVLPLHITIPVICLLGNTENDGLILIKDEVMRAIFKRATWSLYV